jgi:hypothetical protein
MSGDQDAQVGSRAPMFGLALLVTLVAALVLGWFMSRAPGDAPTKPSTGPAASPTVVTNTSAAPTAGTAPALPPPTGECGLQLRVVDWQGAAVAGAVLIPSSEPETALDEASTDDEGRAVVGPIACGSKASTLVQREGRGLHFATFSADEVGAGDELEVALPRFVRVVGQIQDARGNPILGASLYSSADPAARPDGGARFAIWIKSRELNLEKLGVDPEDPEMAEVMATLGGTGGFMVTAAGYDQTHVDVLIPADPSVEEIEQDVTLVGVREVRVRCEGRGPEACRKMHGMTCAAGSEARGVRCRADREGASSGSPALRICPCPPGEATVQADGESVAVGPDDEEVTLVFHGATIDGAVQVDGTPRRAIIELRRRPSTLLGHSQMSASSGLRTAYSNESDGHFRMLSVPPGPATLWCTDRVDGETIEGHIGEIDVPESGVLDVGTLECRQGGGILAQVLHAETGEPREYTQVIARQVGATGQASTFKDGPNGKVRFRGLPAGDWRLSARSDPTAYTTVRVEAGVETDGVVLRVSDEYVMPETGLVFNMIGTEDGSVVLLDVLPGTPASQAGLVAGDRLVRGWLDGRAPGLLEGETVGSGPGPDAAARALFEAVGWDGPGLSFTVLRDGEEVPVELDW